MIVTQPSESGAVLMNAESGDCFELNRVGSEIWNLICRGLSPTDIANKLIGRYPDSGTLVTSDVNTLVDDLLRYGILTVPEK